MLLWIVTETRCWDLTNIILILSNSNGLLLKRFIMKYVNYFYDLGKMDHKVNTSFITFIPK